MKTFEQYNQKGRTLVFKSYFPDENDRIVDITEEEYEMLHPYENQLSMGNAPRELFNLIWEDLYNRSEEILRRNIPNNYDIEVAIC